MSNRPKIDLTAGQNEAELQRVIEMIRAERYFAARERLRTLKHPKAKALLAKLDEVAPVPEPQPCQMCAHDGFRWHRVRAPQASGGMVAIPMEIDETPLLARVCGRCGHVLFFLSAPPGVEVH
jgi:hypothetical protein